MILEICLAIFSSNNSRDRYSLNGFSSHKKDKKHIRIIIAMLISLFIFLLSLTQGHVIFVAAIGQRPVIS
jgi:hypothetical protein